MIFLHHRPQDTVIIHLRAFITWKLGSAFSLALDHLCFLSAGLCVSELHAKL